MKILENYTLDGRATRIVKTDFKNWWILQQFFAYPPFNEFFDTDKLTEYFEEFSNGGINHLEIEIAQDVWAPVALLSWHPMVPSAHPVNFANPDTVAYISDVITCLGYQNKGVQKHLMQYTFEEMKKYGFKSVYLRTSYSSLMYYLAPKVGFEQIPGVKQEVESMRVGGSLGTDERIFFYRQL